MVVAAQEETLRDLVCDIRIDLEVGRLVPVAGNDAALAVLAASGGEIMVIAVQERAARDFAFHIAD